MNDAAVVVVPPLGFNYWPPWLRRSLRLSTVGIQPQWQGGWFLAAGGGGTAALWVTYNDSNRISGRMVVKTMVIGHEEWWDPCLWSDGLNAVGYRDYTAPIDHTRPLEAIIAQRLTQLAGPPIAPQTENPICRYLGHAVDQQNRRWKLFMEYAPYGGVGQYHADLIRRGQGNLIPEPFVWYVAEQCLLAIKIMQQGDTAGGIPGWRSLVHRDLKTSNVLFGEWNTTEFRHYPRLKLCDFGMSCETDANDTNNNPIEFNEAHGTLGWFPPEQKTWYKRNGTLDLNRTLSEKTNVWGIGMMCQALDTQRVNGMDIDYNNVAARNPPVAGASPEMFAFITACLQYDPALRPTIDQALAMVRTPASGRDNFQGMRGAVPAVQLSRDTNPFRLPEIPGGWRDRYKLNFAQGILPPVG